MNPTLYEVLKKILPNEYFLYTAQFYRSNNLIVEEL